MTSETQLQGETRPLHPPKDKIATALPLPACQRCRLRKVKCDRRPPKCSHCLKAKATCIIVDPITALQYSRDEIQQLEDRERELREKFHGASSNTPEGPRRPSDVLVAPMDVSVATVDSSANAPSSASPSGSSAFVGDASGHSLLRVILSDNRWRSCEPQLLRQLAERPCVPEMAIRPNRQPSIEEASLLLDTYFSRFHINHTFLARRHVTDMFHRVYQHPRSPNASDQPSTQDYFRLFMIFALSGVSRFRSGASGEHPVGYYLTAQTYLSNVSIIGSLDAIQNLLLVARFGMYYQIGASPWDVSRFCMRQCIEQNLHLAPQKPVSALHEQHQRRVFWDCYIFDRYSSCVLGRPFAMADRDITIELPVDASDDLIASSGSPRLSDVVVANDGRPTELSIFLFVIKLRRIMSRVFLELCSGRSTGSASGDTTPSNSHNLSAGDVYVKLYHFLKELDTWRESAPVFENPQTLYERPEWHTWMMVKDKLMLTRSAMHIAPKRNGQPPNDLLTMSLDFATRTIELYDHMAQSKWITWTRTYFQVIFTAGLTIFYWISIHAQRPSNLAGPQLEKIEPTLLLCSKILQQFRREMPDAGRFALVFEMLKNNLLPDANPPDALEYSQHHAHREMIGANGGGQVVREAVPPPDITEFPMNMEPASEMQLGMIGAPITELDTRDLSYAETMAWPELTDEFMEILENGLGEYAWGSLEGSSFNWGDGQFHGFQG